MPLISDATAPYALGEAGWIPLLCHVDPEVVISSWVRRELRRFADQVAAGEANGWLRVVEPSRSEVEQLQALVPELERGEIETIVLLGHPRYRDATLLIDEGPAYRFVRAAIAPRMPALEIVCLAQVLHILEDAGHLPTSAASAMQVLLDQGSCAWAPSVRRDDVRWCRQQGKEPLP